MSSADSCAETVMKRCVCFTFYFIGTFTSFLPVGREFSLVTVKKNGIELDIVLDLCIYKCQDMTLVPLSLTMTK